MWADLHPRNRAGARLRFRDVGRTGEPYPAWVRALRDDSGVYVIRERHGNRSRIVYVGESHTDHLYATLTRHFQRWARHSVERRSEHDPGLTYDRDACEVAILVTSADRAIELQYAMITWLRPRDNIVGADPNAVDEVPF